MDYLLKEIRDAYHSAVYTQDTNYNFTATVDFDIEPYPCCIISWVTILGSGLIKVAIEYTSGNKTKEVKVMTTSPKFINNVSRAMDLIINDNKPECEAVSATDNDRAWYSFGDYQTQAVKTALPPALDTTYLIMEIANEAGELAGVLKKYIRHDFGRPESEEALAELRRRCIGELGDVLWPIAVLCSHMCLDMGVIAQRNIEKLSKRAAENKIQGDGDER